MVVPVPCRLLAALKLLISTLPATRSPIVRGTTTIPYGLTSPLAGTVLATVVMVESSHPRSFPRQARTRSATPQQGWRPEPLPNGTAVVGSCLSLRRPGRAPGQSACPECWGGAGKAEEDLSLNRTGPPAPHTYTGMYKWAVRGAPRFSTGWHQLAAPAAVTAARCCVRRAPPSSTPPLCPWWQASAQPSSTTRRCAGSSTTGSSATPGPPCAPWHGSGHPG